MFYPVKLIISDIFVMVMKNWLSQWYHLHECVLMCMYVNMWVPMHLCACMCLSPSEFMYVYHTCAGGQKRYQVSWNWSYSRGCWSPKLGDSSDLFLGRKRGAAAWFEVISSSGGRGGAAAWFEASLYYIGSSWSAKLHRKTCLQK